MPSEAVKNRRREVRRRLAAGESLAATARALGVDRATIRRDRAAIAESAEAYAVQAAQLEPQPDNSYALTNGATAEKRLAPIRDEMAAELRERWPWLDDIRLGVLADRMARFESARRWLDEQPGGVVRDEQGEVFPIVDRSERWANRIEALVTELEAEHRVRMAQAGGLDEYLAGLDDELDAPTTEAEAA